MTFLGPLGGGSRGKGRLANLRFGGKFEVWRGSSKACHGVSRRVGGWRIAGTCALGGHFLGM